MKNLTYSQQINQKNILKLRELRSELPKFLSSYFIGVDHVLASRTKIAYAIDLKTFFEYIKTSNPIYRDKKICDDVIYLNPSNGYKITKEKVIEILNKVYSTPYNKRLEIKGMDKGREDLIIPGILIILEILKKTNLNIITVSDFGLREGAVVRAANS